MVEVNGLQFPLDRKYYARDGAHIWVKSEGEAVKIGMDAFMADNVGFLTFLKVNSGRAEAGEAIGSFESAKFVSRFYSPVSGEIVQLNEEVLSNPRKINEEPYEAWIAQIKTDSEPAGEDILTEEAEIVKWIEEEIKKVESDE